MQKENRPPRKKHMLLRVLLVLIGIKLALCLMALLWFAYSKKDSVASLSAIPGDYSLILHTDNVWEAAGPLLDLKAADSLLTDPTLAPWRAAYLSLRQSPLRKNKYAPLIAGRKLDLAIYMKGETTDFLALTDAGKYSCVTRLAARILPFAKIEGLDYVKDGGYFIYTSRDKDTGSVTRVYLKIRKNLIAASMSPSLLLRAFEKDYAPEHPERALELLEAKSTYPLKILVGAKEFARKAVPPDNIYLSSLVSMLGEEARSLIEFKIDDGEVRLEASVPLEESAVAASPLGPIVSKKSSAPSMLTRFTDNIQYYTLLHAGSLPELKDALFPIIQQTQDIQAAWEEGEKYARKLFKSSIEELVFSWTGTEFALLGVEGSSDPVVVLQVGDEAKRKEAFDKLNKSLLIKNNSSLIVDGVRLPCLDMPSFFKGILKMLKIELPRPYYLVHEGYVYFSESPQNLAILYGRYKAGSMLARNDVWKKISADQMQQAALGLFYNTERSIPFFLQGNGLVTKLLKLYERGQVNFSFEDGHLKAAYHAVATNSYNDRMLPGFPVELEETPELKLEAAPNGRTVFWREGDKAVKSLDFSSLAVSKLLMHESCQITASAEECAGGGMVWVTDGKGAVYLLDKKLQVVRPFPVVTGHKISAEPAAIGRKLLVPAEDGTLVIVDDTGRVSEIDCPPDCNFQSAPAVQGNMAAVYSKGFEGTIYTVQDSKITDADRPMYVDGIAFGSPCLTREGESVLTAMITQAGDFYLFRDGNLQTGFPLSNPGVFGTNVIGCGGAWFALSTEGDLCKITADGGKSRIKVPDLPSAKEASLTSDGERIFVSGDSNRIYAFTSSLEMVYGFPVAGRGKCVIADVNGDGSKDCVVLSLDKKLYAWNLK
ncbi:MAG: hypothetical protein IJR93_05915 [Treponema sp.]|nr:hypothetical protein [Treponema sp.]